MPKVEQKSKWTNHESLVWLVRDSLETKCFEESIIRTSILKMTHILDAVLHILDYIKNVLQNFYQNLEVL
jgi:hypothetical protein